MREMTRLENLAFLERQLTRVGDPDYYITHDKHGISDSSDILTIRVWDLGGREKRDEIIERIRDIVAEYAGERHRKTQDRYNEVMGEIKAT